VKVELATNVDPEFGSIRILVIGLVVEIKCADSPI
jgi:hypothetical protein